MNFSVVLNKQDGFVADAIRELKLMRLARISQLQSLTWLPVGETTPNVPGPHTFGHTRLLPHSILAATLRALICQFLLKSTREETLIAILQDLVHDARTCAGGDAWRTLPDGLVIPSERALFDEDAQILQVFEENRPGWNRLRAKYGLPLETPARVARAVAEETGIEGEIHTLTDTLSYLACDVERLFYWLQERQLSSPSEVKAISELATPEVFDLWQYLVIRDNHIAITDSALLHQLLRLRLALYTGVYHHPGNNVITIQLSNVIYPHLLETRKLRLPQLLRWSDRELNRVIDEVMGVPNLVTHLDAAGEMPWRQSFRERGAMLEAELANASRGHLTLVIDTGQFPAIKTKANCYRVATAEGQARTFAEIYPTESASLSAFAAAVASKETRYHLVVVRNPKLTPPLRRAWEAARARWHAN